MGEIIARPLNLRNRSEGSTGQGLKWVDSGHCHRGRRSFILAGMRFEFSLLASAALLMGGQMRAQAAPPPAPPAYVEDVRALVTGPMNTESVARLAPYIADDVRWYDNGKLLAAGKTEWLRVQSSAKVSPGRVIGFSEGWQDGGNLLVVDEYDTVDRSDLPPNFLADPRMVTRATLYQFGSDRRVHVIRTLVGGSLWIKPRP
ncbi:MAG TPA: hypothetical protein VGC56_05700 [Allosphingosinicella sp.]